MKKIKALQYLVYITFCMSVLHHKAKVMYDGFMEGYHDGYYAMQHGNLQQGPLIRAVLDGGFVANKIDSGLKIGPDYTLQNTTLNSDIRLSSNADTTPWWLNGVDVIIVFGTVTILILIAITINHIIKKIVDGTMFDDLCIQLIRKTASLLILYALADYVFQQVSYFKDSRLLSAPLQIINTSSFNFQTLICAILIFIIAEAFKQGNKLKQEQDLTI